MRSPILKLMVAIALASGTFVCAAETQPAQPPPAADQGTVVQQFTDQLIGLELAPPHEGTVLVGQPSDGTIRLHVHVRPVKTTQPQSANDPAATQPVRDFLVEIDANRPNTRRVYDVGQLLDAGTLKFTDEGVADEARLNEARLALSAIANEQAKADGAYLGVGVDAPDETLRSQLALPPAAGLVVNFVDENGPAKSTVQPHDVLLKFDDQLLINREQLVALVRMRKPGETVSLTLLRHAKPVTVQVELGQRKPAKAEEHSNAGKAGWEQNLPNYWLSYPKSDQIYSSVSKSNNPNNAWFNSQANLQDLYSVYPQNLSNATARSNNAIDFASYLQWRGRLEERPITFNDGELLATFGNHQLLAVDLKDGKVIYHGPIGTESQWNAMPKLLKDKLSSWRSLVCPPETRPAASGKSEPSSK